MQTVFSQDVVESDPDEPLREAAELRQGAVRLRIQPMVFAKDGQYRSWRQNAWTLDCDSVAEAFAARDALRAFFETLSRCGPNAVAAALQVALKSQKGGGA